MNTCETVKVVRDNSDGLGEYTIINKSDFDKKKHKLFVKKPAKKSKKKTAK